MHGLRAMKGLKGIGELWRKASSLNRLIAINVAVFFVIQLYLLSCYISGVSPSLGEDMMLAAADNSEVIAARPWSVLTHMFAHSELGHFLLNMVALYVCGDLFLRLMPPRSLVAVYLLAGLSGFTLYFIMYSLFPSLGGGHDSLILGASAAVMGIVIAVVTIRPQMSVKLFGVFEIQLIWLGVALVLLDLVSIRKGDNTGGHIGHLGGALFGYLYGRRLLKGKNMAFFLSNFVSQIQRLFRGRKSSHRSNPRLKTDEEFNAEKLRRQKRVDEILDKIGRSGYDSLTKEEKDYLFRYSQK